MIHAELRAGNTHPGGKSVAFLRRLKRKVPAGVTALHLRSDSALYDKKVIQFCEKAGWTFTITADQTGARMRTILDLSEASWQPDPEESTIAYADVLYQPTGWSGAYRFLVRRERKPKKTGQMMLFESYEESDSAVVTNKTGETKVLMEMHDKRGSREKRMGPFSNEFLVHLPMGHFMANWAYLLCAQWAYNISLWLRDLVLPPIYRKRHIQRIRRCVGLIAAKVIHSGRQFRIKISVIHRWWKDFVHAWEALPKLAMAIPSG